ncbi:putative Acyl-CoA synthetase family member 4 [Quillaja saponaria]|uniref:Acyl-CoA synthetase family member 4 n=1 Tax=Quillaja saponaria TaxID=32244 RepID=A0AAD7QD73_QUISA|nr:putative Acyl-CoA synthetase family member 4 [Quillaja saponaria]
MDTTASEITDLFARLALHLRNLNDTVSVHDVDEENAIDLSISKLNQSLNLNENSRVRVLDAALSLMGFRAPQVFDSVIEYMVRTITSILRSSVACNVIQFHTEKVLRVGSSISRHDCSKLMEACADVLGKLNGHGMLPYHLSCSVIKTSISASSCRYALSPAPIFDGNSVNGRSTIISKLLSQLPREEVVENNDIPLRLLGWYLDPLILKHDFSKILQETMARPFLCLSKEFHETKCWRSIIIFLVLSPAMFVETRASLYSWFLVTGLVSVLELLIDLTSTILDVVSRPTFWGISVELGLKVPFSNAYFPHNHQLLRTLAGPLSFESFLHLVNAISEPISCAGYQCASTLKPEAVKIAKIDHKSIWALAISFPDWFYFACMLLFSGSSFQGNFYPTCRRGSATIEQEHDVKKCSATAAVAARYIAWVQCPFIKSHQDFLVDNFIRISESWTLKQFGSASQDRETIDYRKKLKKPKFADKKEHVPVRDYCKAINLWLEEFNNIHTRCWNQNVDSSASALFESSPPCALRLQQNVLFRRIPLGILLAHSNYIDDGGCELLLHYASNGKIFQTRELKSSGLNFNSKEAEDLRWDNKCNKEEALAGASFIFRLMDIVESMSASMSETEESGADFICSMKLRAGNYLIKCIKRLIQLKIDEDGVSMLMDLRSRLIQWRHQGKEVIQFHNDLDYTIDVLSHKISVMG